MIRDGKIELSLPSSEAATAERLAESFREFTRELARAGFHAPFLADALRAAVAEAEQLAKGEIADFGPANAPWHDYVARSFTIGYVKEVPDCGAVALEMVSGKEVKFALHVSDMRALGERLIADAKKLANLAVAKERSR